MQIYSITKLFIFLFIAIAFTISVQSYEYTPDVVPHTRHNTQMNTCFYYYGYGSCNVTTAQCSGVTLGENKWINLGDACNRNKAPAIKFTETAKGKEGQRLNLDVHCLDEDPVNLTISGWTTEKNKLLGYEDAGNHQVHTLCTDSFGKTAEGSIKITVENTNRKPIFRSIGWE